MNSNGNSLIFQSLMQLKKYTIYDFIERDILYNACTGSLKRKLLYHVCRRYYVHTKFCFILDEPNAQRLETFSHWKLQIFCLKRKSGFAFLFYGTIFYPISHAKWEKLESGKIIVGNFHGRSKDRHMNVIIGYHLV